MNGHSFYSRVDNQDLQAQHIYKLWNYVIIAERIYTLVRLFCCRTQTSHIEKLHALVLLFCCHTQTSHLIIFQCSVSSQGVPFHRVSFLRCCIYFLELKATCPVHLNEITLHHIHTFVNNAI